MERYITVYIGLKLASLEALCMDVYVGEGAHICQANETGDERQRKG